MFRYIDSTDDSFLQNDETYQRILEQLSNPSFVILKSEEDKQLILKMISNCFHKYHNSMKTKSGSDAGHK